MEKEELCPRLADFLVLVGRRAKLRLASRRSQSSAAADPSNQQQQQLVPPLTITTPEILRRYPSDEHRDFVLPTDVTYFCQPEGCISVGRQSSEHVGEQDTASFVFQLTEKDTSRVRYGITLNFFQATDRHLNQSNQPANAADKRQRRSQRKRETRSLTSLCIISHHPFVGVFRDLLVLFKKLVDACDRKVASIVGQKNLVWSVLLGHLHSPAAPSVVLDELRQLETWLLTLLSSPVPVPGKTKVQLEVLPQDLAGEFELALPDHTRFRLVDFPIHLPIELLGVDNALKVLVALMLECKVVMQSRHYNAVSMSVLALVALLYPLDYMFPVIPLLPSSLPSAEQLLLAPTPFIIGVPSSFWTAKQLAERPSDVILVDLDTNLVDIPDEVYVPELPEPDARRLKETLTAILNRSLASADGSALPVDNDEIDVAVRIAMVRFLNGPGVFANFDEHTRTLRLYPRPVVSLQVDSFLRSRPSLTDFADMLCRTQAVEYFAECCLCPSNETFVRVQAGVQSARDVGDKPKWFGEQLMPVHFAVYPDGSTLADTYLSFAANPPPLSSDEEEEEVAGAGSSTDEEGAAELDTISSVPPSSSCDIDELSVVDVDSLAPDERKKFEERRRSVVRPITAEVDGVYREPMRLEVPHSDSALSIGSSISSGSPSSISQSAVDSEADFARLAANLALKSDSRGGFIFDRERASSADEDVAFTAAAGSASATSTPTPSKSNVFKLESKKSTASTPGTSGGGGSAIMSALNGYAEKSHGMLNQVLTRSAPKAQAVFASKAVRPLAAAAAQRVEQGQHAVRQKAGGLRRRMADGSNATTASSTTAIQQGKSQQAVRELCDAVLAGQGVGVFAWPRLRRLMDDESLREFACKKLNLGLDEKYSDESFVKERLLTRAQYKGYVKVLQACISGIEAAFATPGSQGVASLFHVLEIAHTHYWSREAEVTAASSGIATPAGTATPPNDESLLMVSSRRSSTASNHHTSMSSRASISQPAGPPPVQAPPPPPPPSSQQQAAPPARPPPVVPPRPSSQTNGAPPPPPPPVPATTLTTVQPLSRPSTNGGGGGGRDLLTGDGSATAPAPQQPPPLPTRSSGASTTANGAANGSVAGPPTARPPLPPRPPAPAVATANHNHLQQHAPTLHGPLPSLGGGLATGQSLGPSGQQQQQQQQSAKRFVYQELVGGSSSLPIWQNVDFWECCFVDVVAKERDQVGADEEPSELLERYARLADAERKRLELDEDRLLTTLLHNLTAYMVMCGTQQKLIQTKVRRLLGKAHIGLVCSKTINKLLEDLPQVQSNTVALRPLFSRMQQKHSFTVYAGTSTQADMCFMEVCDDAVVLRAVSGAVTDRWWYERLVNMTYSPRTKVLCLWRRHDDAVQMHQFYTKKCRELYLCLKSAMERAAARGRVSVEGRRLGGEFAVHDTERNQGGLLQVRVDGVAVVFADRQIFIELGDIKKCNTFGGNVFVLEEFDRQRGELVTRRYYSQMADQICYAVLCVFSFVAAGRQLKRS